MSKAWIGVAVLTFLAAWPCAAAEADRTVTATGNAEIRVPPDEVILRLGIESFEVELETAKADNDRRASAVIAAAQAAGVTGEHVQTEFLMIEPRYKDQWQKMQFLGYGVRKTIVLTVRDVGSFEDVLSSVLEAGANYVHGIEFRTTELRKHRDAARNLAIVAAREKAEALAGQLGQGIGRPVTIQEGYSGWGSTYGTWWGSTWSGPMAQNVVQSQGTGQGSDGPTSPGQIAVSATITVTFELVDASD